MNDAEKVGWIKQFLGRSVGGEDVIGIGDIVYVLCYWADLVHFNFNSNTL